LPLPLAFALTSAGIVRPTPNHVPIAQGAITEEAQGFSPAKKPRKHKGFSPGPFPSDATLLEIGNRHYPRSNPKFRKEPRREAIGGDT